MSTITKERALAIIGDGDRIPCRWGEENSVTDMDRGDIKRCIADAAGMAVIEGQSLGLKLEFAEGPSLYVTTKTAKAK